MSDSVNVTHDDGENLSLLAAEAFAALERARGHAGALAATLDEAANSMRLGRLDRHLDQLAKLIELQRLVAVRVDVLARRIGEGGA